MPDTPSDYSRLAEQRRLKVEAFLRLPSRLAATHHLIRYDEVLRLRYGFLAVPKDRQWNTVSAYSLRVSELKATLHNFPFLTINADGNPPVAPWLNLCLEHQWPEPFEMPDLDKLSGDVIYLIGICKTIASIYEREKPLPLPMFIMLLLHPKLIGGSRVEIERIYKAIRVMLGTCATFATEAELLAVIVEGRWSMSVALQNAVALTRAFGKAWRQWLLPNVNSNMRDGVRRLLDSPTLETLAETAKSWRGTAYDPNGASKPVQGNVVRGVLLGAFSLASHRAWVTVEAAAKNGYLKDDLRNYLLKHCKADPNDLMMVCRSWRRLPKAYRANPPVPKILIEQSIQFLPSNKKWQELRGQCPAIVEQALRFGYGLRLTRAAMALYLRSQAVLLPNWAIGTARQDYLEAHFLPRSDARGVFVGHYTECCQHLEGAKWATRHGQSSPYGCFWVVEKHGEIVAQAWAWEGRDGRVCFDNIEACRGFRKDKAIENLLAETARAIAVGGRLVTVGTRYSDINIFGIRLKEALHNADDPVDDLLKAEDTDFPVDFTKKELADTDAREQLVLVRRLVESPLERADVEVCG